MAYYGNRFEEWRSDKKLQQGLDEGMKEAGLDYVDIWRISLLVDSSQHTEAEVEEAVKALGLARLNTINQGRLPRFQGGGAVMPRIPRFSEGGGVSKSSPSKTVELNLNIGGQTFTMATEDSVADSLAQYLKRSEF